MAIYPGATYQPVHWSEQEKYRRSSKQPVNRANWHTAVSNSSNLKSYFDGGVACSHFYINKDGKVYQYTDTAFWSAADLDGNDATISVETWDGYGSTWHDGDPVPALNSKQLAASKKLWAWIRDEYDLPNKLATDSKSGGAKSSKGLSWHRIGIDGNFPDEGILRGRLQRGGGMHYTKQYGKVCPGDAKIKQMDEILDGGSGGGGGGSKPKPEPKPDGKGKRKPHYPGTLQYGGGEHSRGTKVGYWQDILNMGGASIAVDESYGPNSKSETRTWQSRRNCTVDGRVGPESWTRGLLTDSSGTLSKGDKNHAVCLLQCILGITVDKSFGPDTEEATKELQRFLGVTDDGKVYWETVNALREYWS